jgi:hypothetical protein
MLSHRKSPSLEQFNTRLLNLEFYRVRCGLARYAARAASLAQDIEASGSHSAAAIRRTERILLQTLSRLEVKVAHAE